jgi:hypothetical protein
MNATARLATLATLLAAAPVAAATLTRGPYLQHLTTDAVTIVWRTDLPAACAVALRPVGGDGGPVVAGGSGTTCAVRAAGLRGGARYAYQPLADGLPLGPPAVFRTDHPDLPVTFLALGDSGKGGTQQLAVRDRMLEVPADFIVHTGDVVYPEGAAEDYQAKFFEPYRDLLRERVFWPALGNHDVRTGGGRPWRDVFHTPANNPAGSEHYYSFDAGNAHVVVLDSNQCTEPGCAQHAFLDQDLRASNTTWTLVVFHHTVYSSGWHGSNARVRDDLGPLFDAHGVDVVLMGHDHHYERTLPLRNQRVAGPGEGTVYVTTGGGGATLRAVGAKWFTAHAESVAHFVRGRIDGGTLAMDMIRVDGTIGDSTMLVKGPAAAPPRCGDARVDPPGEDCDGAADAACPGLCLADCTCPPRCGDGRVNVEGEACDGRDDGGCPGLCGADCLCGAPPLVLELAPAADTYVRSGSEATWDHGRQDYVHVDASPSALAYLKFDLGPVTGPVRSATLFLSCVNPAPAGGTVYPVSDSTWLEGTALGSDARSADGSGLRWIDVDTDRNGIVDERDTSAFVPDLGRPFASVGAVEEGQTVAFDVTGALQAGPTVYTLALAGAGSDGAGYASREHPVESRRPRLRLEIDRCVIDADCDNGTFCDGGEVCAGGECRASPPPCEDGVACTADSCVEEAGGCVHAPDHDRCADASVCTTDACDPATGCRHTPVPDGAPCADADLCNGTETCQAGVCTPGPPLFCDDANVCTTDACDPATGCRHTPLPDGAPCTDTNRCNGAETCQAGACTPGEPLACHDGSICTIDVCDPDIGCRHTDLPDGTSCADPDLCNGTETCQAGTCTPGTPFVCDDANACTADRCEPTSGCQNAPLADGTPCADADLCDGAETCEAGFCIAGTAIDCDDASPCTIDTCEPSGRCRHALGGGCGPITLEAAADTYIERGEKAAWDHGAAPHLDVDTRPAGIAYLRFDLGALGAPVETATLTLWCTNPTPDGGVIHPVADSSWTEGTGTGLDATSARGEGLTWVEVDTNRDGTIDGRDASPYVPNFARPVAALGAVDRERAVSVDVTAAFRGGPGLYTLAIRNRDTNGATYASREDPSAARRPQLRLTLADSR